MMMTRSQSQSSKTFDTHTDDVARPAEMARSFVSLLTTATMYSGNLSNLMQDARMPLDEKEELEQEKSLSDVPDIQDLEVSEASADSEVEEEGVEPFVPTDLADTTAAATLTDNTPTPTARGGRARSIFEISMVEKFDGTDPTEDIQARAKELSAKLRSTFDISEDDTFIGEYSCWLLKDVLLQGHIYLTKSHLLFLAFLPKSSGEKTALSGNLAMETSPPKKLSRYWTVLKNHTLSLYNKSTDLYFPVHTIDLRYAIRAEVLNGSNGGRWFRVLTETKSYRFQADSANNARSWVGFLKKHIFAIRNKGECVTVKIPLQNILDAEESSIFDAAETIRLKVLEGADSFAYDDYFFMFFTSGPDAFRSITECIEKLKEDEPRAGPDILTDSTARPKVVEKRRLKNPLKHIFSHRSSSASTLSSPSSIAMSETTSSVSEIAALTSPELRGLPDHPQESVIEQYLIRDVEDIPDDLKSDDSSAPESEPSVSIEQASTIPTDLSAERRNFTLPINTKNIQNATTSLGRWGPKLIKSAGAMWTSNPIHYSEKNSLERGSEDEFLANAVDRAAFTKRFQTHFSLSESDMLISTYFCYLHRNIPLYGKVYLGENEICFRSLLPGVHTKMILPFTDIENCYKEKGFKFGFHGLVIVIHGHEELFLEFSSKVARDDCEYLLLKQLEATGGSTSPRSDNQMSSSKKLEAAKIKFFEDKIHSQAGLEVPIMIEDHPILKTSIKPGKAYKFMLMTIGSRGDVQPFIALALGLKEEGHDVTIATHLEFEDWILKHGIKFKEIAGNPTELMALMVQHGSMNVGLVREASSKFRGWITELLDSAWTACQGTEILIESPSSMAGIHVAEALKIPYFRAFTMPWTRTRAYPHAFIVPDEKKGGSYNYFTHVLFENIFWKGISGQVNKWRTETLGLRKTNLDLLQQSKVPFMYNVSPTVLPPPVDFSDWVKVTGYWFLNEAVTYDPPQPLLDFMAKARKDGKKLVYIGFGSIVVSNPKELTQAVVDSVVDADVRCILNKGWSERLGGPSKVEIDLPDQVYNAGALPHDWLFPQIDAAVHHGGSGTTGATLRAGLPTIIKPFFGDQFFYANRVEDMGAGIALKKLNVKTLSKALKEATTDQRMILKAKNVGESICKENGVQEAINVIYRELEYARSLILNKSKAPVQEITEESVEDSSLSMGMESSDSGGSGSWFLV